MDFTALDFGMNCVTADTCQSRSVENSDHHDFRFAPPTPVAALRIPAGKNDGAVALKNNLGSSRRLHGSR
jgi:hypothetical protein